MVDILAKGAYFSGPYTGITGTSSRAKWWALVILAVFSVLGCPFLRGCGAEGDLQGLHGVFIVCELRGLMFLGGVGSR